MSKTIVYIAASLDGYIARKNDDISWLDQYEGVGEDYGWADFIKTVGTAIMGARTYEQSLKHPERKLTGIKSYVLSKKSFHMALDADVEFYNDDIKALIARIKKENDRNIFIVGGGQVVSSFLNAGLVDDVFHFAVPILLKEGIPLYSALSKEINFTLIEAVPYKTGILKLHYAPKH